METKIESLLSGPVVALNLGLSQFAASLEEQSVQVVQIDWSPPAGGDKEMENLLEKIM
jgi:hypothetical protein